MTAYIVTRIKVPDYDAWKPMFDQDGPNTREHAVAQRVFRGADDPNEVFIFLEYETEERAQEARTRLTESGVLERFDDKHGPTVVAEVG